MLRFIFILFLFLAGPAFAATVGAPQSASAPVPPVAKPIGPAAPNAAPAIAPGQTYDIIVSKPATISKVGPTTVETIENADPYTIRGIKVDISAETSLKARDKAFLQGQHAAFEQLAKNLSAENAATNIDEARIGKLIKSFEVESERASGTRYTATLTYHFKPQETAALLGKGGDIASDPNKTKRPDGGLALSATTMPVQRTLVLPILRSAERSILWEEKTAWHKAWDNVLLDRPNPSLIVPEGTIQDVGAITASEALAGLNLPLTRIMHKYQAREVLVAVLVANNTSPQPSQNLSVQLARFDAQGKILETATMPVPAQPTRNDMQWLQANVTSTIAVWQDILMKEKQKAAMQPLGQPGGVAAPITPNNPAGRQSVRVTLTVPFATMDEWAAKRDTLQTIPGMASLEVLRMNRYRAVIRLDYTGEQTQLDQALTTRNMVILPSNPPDGTYVLSSTGQPINNGMPTQPVFTTVYPTPPPVIVQQGQVPIQQPLAQPPLQMQPAQIQPVGQPELMQEQPIQNQPIQNQDEQSE